MTVLLSSPTRPPVPAAEAELLAAESDRGALADALHDGAVQALVSARWAIDGGDLALAREAVQAALVEVRHTLWHLRPRGDDLAGALEQLAERPSVRPLVLDLDRAARTTPALAAAAYRLVQLSASTPGGPLVVTLAERPEGVVLDLSGATLPPDPWPDRLAALGATLMISPDTGTREAPTDLRLTLPHAPLTAKAHP